MASHRQLILQLLEKWACAVPPGGIRPEHRLVHDLKMDGDDYGMSLVPELEKQFGIRPSRQEWEIATVGELLDVIDRHLGQTSGSGDRASA